MRIFGVCMLLCPDSGRLRGKINCMSNMATELIVVKIKLVVFVQSLSHVWFFATPWTAACQAPLSSTISRSSLKSMSIDQWCYLTVSSSFPFAFSLSHHQGLFQWLALCIRWPKYWIFSFSISPSNEYSGLISLRINWFILRNWLTRLWRLQSKRLSRVFSNTPNQRHKFLGAQSSLWSNSHIHT